MLTCKSNIVHNLGMTSLNKLQSFLSLSLWGNFSYSIFLLLKLYGDAVMEGDKARDSKKEFFFDHSYWSVDPKDQHFITQEQVRIVLNAGTDSGQ